MIHNEEIPRFSPQFLSVVTAAVSRKKSSVVQIGNPDFPKKCKNQPMRDVECKQLELRVAVLINFFVVVCCLLLLPLL